MESGIITRESKYAFEETVTRLEALLRDKAIKIFAVIDHSGEAAAAGLRMLPTKLLIFGNPKGGTPVMQAAPSAALDLPLKILVAEDPAGTVRLSWNDADYLQGRHGFPAEFLGNLGAAAALAGQLAK